jgi:hypothetical protein
MPIELRSIVCIPQILQFESGVLDAELFGEARFHCRFDPFARRAISRHDMAIQCRVVLLHLPQMNVVDIMDPVDLPDCSNNGIIVDVGWAT